MINAVLGIKKFVSMVFFFILNAKSNEAPYLASVSIKMILYKNDLKMILNELC